MRHFTSIITLSFLISMSVQAQVLFTEDFESVSTPNLPTNWTTTTQGSDAGFYTGSSEDALQAGFWIIKDHTTFAMTNNDVCVCDKSNDLLILPEQDFSTYTSETIFLSFDSWMEDFWGGISKVKVDTGNGWIDIYTIEPIAEWQNRIVNLSPFAGCSNVQIAFHYNDEGLSGLGLAIDNVSLYIPENTFDASIYRTTNDFSEFTYIPESQLIPIDHKAEVYNKGADTLWNIQVIANSEDMSYKDTLFYNYLAPAQYISDFYNNSCDGVSTNNSSISYQITHSETDDYPIDNNYTVNFNLSDSIMAKESGSFNDALIPQSGETVAQRFTIFSDDTLTSISVRLLMVGASDSIKFYIYEYDEYYGPTNIIDSSMVSYTPQSGWHTYSLAKTNASGIGLLAGQYAIGIKKMGTGLTSICSTTDYYTPNTTFTSHDEVFGYYFYADEQAHGGVAGEHHTYLIRTNFGATETATPVPSMQSDHKLTMFPNPANSFVKIQSDKQIEELRIYDLSGKLILSQEFYNKNCVIDVSTLHKGLYVMQAKMGKRIENIRLMITE